MRTVKIPPGCLCIYIYIYITSILWWSKVQLISFMLYFWIMYYYYLLTWTFVWIISLDLTVESTFYFEHLVYFHVDLLGPPPCGKADHQERVQHGDLTNENSKILPMQHFIPVEGTTNRQPMWSMNKRDWRITIPMEPSWNIETGPVTAH